MGLASSFRGIDSVPDRSGKLDLLLVTKRLAKASDGSNLGFVRLELAECGIGNWDGVPKVGQVHCHFG